MLRYFTKLILILFCILFFLNNAALSQVRYSVIDLGTLGGANSEAYAINDASQVTGSSETAPIPVVHAFIWQNGVMSDLGTFVTQSDGRAINNSGHVAGSSINTNNTTEAVLWRDNIMIGLGSLGTFSVADGINNLDQIVGYSPPFLSEPEHAFLWEGGVMIDLGTLGGTNPRSKAYGINNLGQVVGEAAGSGIQHAFLWENGVMTDIGTLGGSFATASAINNSGEVVGVSSTSSNSQHAFLWRNGVMTDLGTLGGSGSFSYAVAINDSGQVIGGHNSGFFLWQNGVMFDLKTLIDTSTHWALLSIKGINNRGEIVGMGRQNNGSNRAILLRPQTLTITSPQPGEFWIAGEQDTIKWYGGQPGQQLTLEYSKDSGTTYDLIQLGYLADSGKYIWNIPKDILSTKMKIKISDLADSTIKTESDTFKIKGYILTKYFPNGNYKPYSMFADPWGFSNNAAGVWNANWYNRFDYQGTDLFTGSQYSQWQGNFVFATSVPSEHIDWPSVVNAFGTGACYISTSLGIYSPSALSFWESIKGRWQGSCYGIAVSNFLVWENKVGFQNRYPNFPDFTNPNLVFSDTNTIPVINELFTYQFGNPHKSYRSNVGFKKWPTQTLNDLKQMFITDGVSLQTLTIINNPPGSGGHEVLAYKVEKDSANPNIFYVYVYDNSYPDSLNARIVFNTSANSGNGSWNFNHWPTWGGNQWIFLEDPVSNFLVDPALPKLAGQQSPFIVGDSILQIRTAINASVKIQDAVGNITGYINGSIQNDIPNSIPLIFLNGSETPPYGYELPADNYSVTMNNFSQDTLKAFFFTGNKTFAYKRAGASETQTDRFYFDGDISSSNPDQETKEITLVSIINETSQEKLFALRAVELLQNDSVKVENPDDDKLKLTSYGSAKDYDIELNFVSENQLGRFGASNISLQENTTHTLIPNWSDITNNELLILEDIGNDGSIDDTITVTNTVDVDDKGLLGIPEEYDLAQNYPNPFNPTTNIEYSLPYESNVKISVFNILGEKVRELVNTQISAGTHTVTFNASNLASGIYIYIMETKSITGLEGFTAMRKMILMK